MDAPKVCIIGAGPSGIAAAKSLLEAGLRDITIFDKNDRVGGNWVYDPRPGHSSVYETAHSISSRRLSQFDAFPMPPEYPDFPSHGQLQHYFASYAERFGVTHLVRFGTEVKSADPRSDGRWVVASSGPAGERTQTFDFLMVANGHHWDPQMPRYPGEFAGEFLHAHFYKSAAPFAGKRVLVIGGGNSACDIAVETSRISQWTGISMRRGYYIFPKFLFGRPVDVMGSKIRRLPRPLRQKLAKAVLLTVQGTNRRYGLPAPDHEPLEQHPTLNSELLYAIRHGRVHPRPDISRFEGKFVHFVDGRSAEFDAVVAATGYKMSFPFFDPSLIDFSQAAEVPLYLNVFHPRHRSLYFIGLVQPVGCIWPLSEMQARIVAREIKGTWSRPSDIDARIRRQIERPHFRWAKTHRHAIEVDYHTYRWELERELLRAA
jgi:cation diffusion facilitator CzcD-associated flavoprotein CzcO